MAKLPKQPYKGARDFYPEDKRLQNYIFDTWHKVMRRYGYEEYDAPLIELTDLYRAKSGEELVNEQTYTFEDRGGRDVTIRPEMTPSISRMVAARRQELAYPLRWYSIPRLWRYERPQQGRLREHWQLNADIFGVPTVDAELELIMIVDDIMKQLGAEQSMYTIRVNSRKMTGLIMAEYLDLDAAQSHQVIKLLDKRRKIDEKMFEENAKSIIGEKNQETLKKLLGLLGARTMGDLPASLQGSDSVKQIQIMFTHLKESHIDNAVFDVSLMRGFDYYTDIVFEVFDNNADNPRSMFGGGRYDGLVGLFGVDTVPTVGFGMGDVTVNEFIEGHDLLPDLKSPTDLYIVVVGKVLRQAQGIAGILRGSGINAAVDITDRKLDKQIASADKKRIPYVMFVGERELNSEQFPLRELKSGEENSFSLEQIIEKLSKK